MSCLFFSQWQSWLLSGKGYAKAKRSVVQVSSETNGSDVAQFWPAHCHRESNRNAPLLSSSGDSKPCPTLQTEEGEERQQIWLLGGLAGKLFTSRFFMTGVTDFYVVKVGFHCPVDSKKPYVTCSSPCCVLRGCPTSTVIITADLISSSVSHTQSQHAANKPSKATGHVHQAMPCPPGDHGMEQNDDQRKSIQNAVPVTREMGHFRFKESFRDPVSQQRNTSMCGHD